MCPLKMTDTQRAEYNLEKEIWYREFVEILGNENVLTSFSDRLAYGRDRWPYANLTYRFGKVPRTLPRAVLMPGSCDEVRGVLKVANRHAMPLVPYGAGSGVSGGAVPLNNEIMLDLKRLNRIITIDPVSGIAIAEAGLNGELFEAALNKRGLTLGHFPQSLNVSTIGGWLSCRSAGQASSRYGKIEDMVIGLKVLLPEGQLVEVRPVPRRSVGPSIKDLFVGAEGTLGVIVEGTFRVLPYPKRETVHVVGFKDYMAGLDALRKIMQAELRPAIVRLYDEFESAPKIKDFPEYAQHPCVSMFTFSGLEELVEVEERLTLRICTSSGGMEGSPEPAFRWMEHRFESLSAKPVFEGRMLDTIEIAAPWVALSDIYEGMRDAIFSVREDAHFGAHWSHAYSDGACMYATFIIPASDEAQAAGEHTKIWDRAMKVCLKAGGTISHHHGIGYFRSPWFIEELGPAHGLLQTVKNAIDPNHIMNPGKLGLG